MEQLSQLCERARTWASLRADGELSELESGLLDAHLGRCVRCRTLARDFESAAGVLRAAALERPAQLALPFRPPYPWLRLVPAAVAAAALVAAGLAAASSAPGPKRAPARPVAMVAASESPDGLRQLRRRGLVDRRNKSAFGHSV
jgi:predicted anti-sigma-YlaC factor YlaD